MTRDAVKCDNLGRMKGTGPKKHAGLKASRATPRGTSLGAELLELNRALQYLLPEGPHYLRPLLKAQAARLGDRSNQPASETDVAQMLAEQDGDAVEPEDADEETLPSKQPRPKRS